MLRDIDELDEPEHPSPVCRRTFSAYVRLDDHLAGTKASSAAAIGLSLTAGLAPSRTAVFTRLCTQRLLNCVTLTGADLPTHSRISEIRSGALQKGVT